MCLTCLFVSRLPFPCCLAALFRTLFIPLRNLPMYETKCWTTSHSRQLVTSLRQLDTKLGQLATSHGNWPKINIHCVFFYVNHSKKLLPVKIVNIRTN